MLGNHNTRDVGIYVLVWLGLTFSMLLCCPIEHQPDTWAINRWLLPWLPSFAILCICFR